MASKLGARCLSLTLYGALWYLDCLLDCFLYVFIRAVGVSCILNHFIATLILKNCNAFSLLTVFLSFRPEEVY